MEGIIIFFVIASIVTSIANAAKKTRQNDAAQRGGFTPSLNGASKPGAYAGSATSEQRARLEQLRRLQQQRQASGGSGARSYNPYAEKPVVPHESEACGGGSIHDGYHEGTVRRPAPASSAEGRLGKQGVSAVGAAKGAEMIRTYMTASEDLASIEKTAEWRDGLTKKSDETANETRGADKIAQVLSDKPPIVQGLVWAEILGRPLSDG